MGMCFYMLFHIMCSRHHCWGMWPTAACSFPCMCLVPTGEATWLLQVAKLVVDWRYLRPKRISNDPFANQFLNPLWTSGGNRGNIFFKQDLSPEKRTIFLTAHWYSRIWQISRCARSPKTASVVWCQASCSECLTSTLVQYRIVSDLLAQN